MYIMSDKEFHDYAAKFNAELERHAPRFRVFGSYPVEVYFDEVYAPFASVKFTDRAGHVHRFSIINSWLDGDRPHKHAIRHEIGRLGSVHHISGRNSNAVGFLKSIERAIKSK